MLEEPYQRLQRARRKAGYLGPAEAAEAFGWNKNTYKSHENGVRGLTKAAATRYGRAFHVSPGWLLTGEGDEAARPSPQEAALLAKYRVLPPQGQEIVETVCDILARPRVVTSEEPPADRKRGRS